MPVCDMKHMCLIAGSTFLSPALTQVNQVITQLKASNVNVSSGAKVATFVRSSSHGLDATQGNSEYRDVFVWQSCSF